MSTGLVDQIFDYLGNDSAEQTGTVRGYCKLPNGTLICWGTVSFPPTSTGVQTVQDTFPVSFIASPWACASWRDTVSTPSYMDYVYATNSSTKTSIQLAAKRLDTRYAWSANYIAIGRWK